MRCAQFRTALSARLDGEAAGLPDSRLDGHVARCAGCRDWLEQARRLRAGVAASAADGPPADWSARLLARLEEDGPGGPQR
ncbi:zf-HC2 domain-containing protein [Streptomyces sp. SP17BM10]|uniref:zf-HC2 domain-containing protein n=1 Tax=Streptomyces sp. SP17BM10 TaxID=3002530 RepID=UPI002E7A07F3|nr:zf-HC2 domain-containing protein [Streptomyces sp. SP17BM10]MEE1787607.1 zf-HC2 domain-containing protein [Streptomyces sp. SP17BM10]